MTAVNTPHNSTPDLSALDHLTGGALTAATSNERLTLIRDWLASDPSLELLQQVFKELSARDKGAAKTVKEKIEELRPIGQNTILSTSGDRCIVAPWFGSPYFLFGVFIGNSFVNRACLITKQIKSTTHYHKYGLRLMFC
jgi:hypothetical protein